MTVKDDHDDDENYLAVDINKAKQDDCWKKFPIHFSTSAKAWP
jgi:hypothetical protein